MINLTLNATKKIGALLAMASGLMLTATSSPVLAQTPPPPTSGTIDGTVTYTEAQQGLLLMNIKDASTGVVVTIAAYSVAPPSPCQAWVQPADALKAYQSVAQSAELSGKQIHVAYNICDPSNTKVKHAWAVGLRQ